jgi:putative ubiquitin-RnfH superfamily antitoxin RatB of RatAB toxin-antitoxin module
MAEQLKVTVCYATPTSEFLRELQVAPGATIREAIDASGVLGEFPEIDLAAQPVGLYGKKQALDTILREHDQVEIYRPLVADPKESRRRRAQHKVAAR